MMKIVIILCILMITAVSVGFAFTTGYSSSSSSSPAPSLVVRRRVVVVGGGPSGCTAAIYLGRALLNPLLLSGYKAGGQLMLTTEIENFPGVPSDVTGPELMERMLHQARRFGAEIWQTDCEHIDFSSRPFRVRVHNCTVEADAVILASGADALWLGADNEEEFRGRGLSTCATCDGFLYRNRSVVVVGGGDSALEEAMHLARLASDVTVIHRRSELRASKMMIQRARAYSNIKFLLNAEVVRWEGQGEGGAAPAQTLTQTHVVAAWGLARSRQLVGVTVRDKDTNSLQTLKCDGGFIAIGHSPNSKFIPSDVQLDADGYVLTGSNVAHPSSPLSAGDGGTAATAPASSPFSTMTSMAGVFACGDLVDKYYRQAVTAAASGCQAALDAERWLLEDKQGQQAVRVTMAANSHRPPSASIDEGGEKSFAVSRKSIANVWLAARRFASNQWLKVRRRTKE